MLDKKQKRFLKAKGQTTEALYQIGKNGISDNTIVLLDTALESHELIKVSVLQNVETDVREIALDLSSSLHADLVQIIGNKIILYRYSKKKDIKHIL